jgi:hypothetical protein
MDITSKEPNRFSGLIMSSEQEGNSHKKAQQHFVIFVPFCGSSFCVYPL